MIPVTLKLSGFLSYQSPAELSFDGFDLACITGANGSGKSSLLDAITWALFGQARKRDDTLINSHSKGAEVIYDFRYEGDTYRVQRSKVHGKPTMLDFFILGENDHWRPLSERTLRETESRIEQVLRMDYETFTNASFFLQGKADQFAQQRPGDRKRILGSILGLEVWETYRERALQRRRKLESQQAGLDNRLEEIETELQQESERKERLKSLQEELDQLAALRKVQEESLEQQRKLHSSLQEQARLFSMLKAQLEAARSRRGERAATLAARKEEHTLFQRQVATASEIDTAFDQWQKLRKELETWEEMANAYRSLHARRAHPLMKIEAERSRLKQEVKTLTEQRCQIQELEQGLPDLREQHAVVKKEIKQTITMLELRSELEDELKTLQETVANSAAENKRMKLEMQDLKQRIDQLDGRTSADCPLCGQPLDEQERTRLLDDLQIQGRQLGDRYRSNQEFFQKAEDRQKEIQKEVLDLKKMDPYLRLQQRQNDQLEDEIRQTEEAAAHWQQNGGKLLEKSQALLADEKFALDAHSELNEIDKELQAVGYEPAKHEAVRQAELKMRTSEEQKRELDRARAALQPLEREIREIEKSLSEDDAEIGRQEKEYLAAAEKYEKDAQNQPDIPRAESALYEIEEKGNRLRVEYGGAKQKVEVLKTLQARKKEYQAKRENLTRQIARLKTLERAFSKDGVPALLIEQALPEIEMQANEILDRLSAGGMSVRFETQQEYKDKKRDDKKETLDILISDAAGMRDYSLFSGGEAFRVNFAIRLALSRVLAQRAGARLQTLVIDEGFGSQDLEGRQRLIESINMVRDDFEKILVITHLEELKEAFPARIEVTKTQNGSQLQVVT